MDIYNDTYLPDILHDIAQGLLAPTMICIILLIAVSAFFVGRIIVEYFTERRHYKQNRAAIVNDINDASYENITDVVIGSGLLRFQKSALVTVSRNMGLSEDALFSLAQMEIAAAEKLYKRRLAWTDTISKIAPLLGLMGTLIPLGPGIVALGQNEVLALSHSLLLAFDATVCGLVCAILALIVSKIRSGWYGEYIETLESVMGCVVDKASQARAAGVKLPTNYTGNPLEEFKAADQAAREAAKTVAQNTETASAAVEPEAAAGETDAQAPEDATALSVEEDSPVECTAGEE